MSVVDALTHQTGRSMPTTFCLSPGHASPRASESDSRNSSGEWASRSSPPAVTLPPALPNGSATASANASFSATPNSSADHTSNLFLRVLQRGSPRHSRVGEDRPPPVTRSRESTCSAFDP